MIWLLVGLAAWVAVTAGAIALVKTWGEQRVAIEEAKPFFTVQMTANTVGGEDLIKTLAMMQAMSEGQDNDD